jgi:hypothetical protein
MSGNNDVARSDDRVWSRSPREIPSFLIMAFRVVRGHPETGGRNADHATGLAENAQDVIPLNFLESGGAGVFHDIVTQFIQWSAEAGTSRNDDPIFR